MGFILLKRLSPDRPVAIVAKLLNTGKIRRETSMRTSRQAQFAIESHVKITDFS
jgi:hypothetical protein